MKKTVTLAIAAAFCSTMAFAQSIDDQIITEYTAKGFSRIDITSGVNQTKVEAIRGRQKVAVVYDNTTGRILQQDVERVRSNDETTPGVTTGTGSSDFVDGSGNSRDDDSNDNGTDDSNDNGTDDSNDNGTDDSNDNGTDDSNDNGTDDSNDNGTDDSNDNGTDDSNDNGTDDNGTDDSNDSDSNDSDSNDSNDD